MTAPTKDVPKAAKPDPRVETPPEAKPMEDFKADVAKPDSKALDAAAPDVPVGKPVHPHHVVAGHDEPTPKDYVVAGHNVAAKAVDVYPQHVADVTVISKPA